MNLEEKISRIPNLDREAMEVAEVRQSHLTKPAGALGRLEELSIRLAGITGEARPRLSDRSLVVAAASHGVTEEGVSAYPASVTAQMVQNILGGGAAINVLTDTAGARLIVVDAGVEPEPGPHPELRSVRLAPGTRNMLREPAMTRENASSIVEAGIALVEELADVGTTLLGFGDMGIGNTTAAAAVVAAITGTPVEKVTGRGTMIEDEVLERKRAVISSALELHQPDPEDALDVLSAVGGYEIGFLAGCCLGAATRRIPIVLDGLPVVSAALLADKLAPTVRNYMIAGHLSVEPGQTFALQHLGLEPLLDLGMRLGEGSGAALAMPVVVAAARTLDEMATFGEASVDEEIDAG
ncbi:MAG: nicotinate-nucleotide--dimethylbenzimidazole phosphoribosyltransferase [Rubrobacteraceae bacterium]